MFGLFRKKLPAEARTEPVNTTQSARPPTLVVMAMTSRCNLRCVMCEHSMMKVEKKDFDLDLVPRMGDFIASALNVDLTGLGDPLLSNSFWQVIDRYPVTDPANPRHFFLGFTTNGTRLTPGNVERVLRSRVRTIRISIDAADEKTFREIRKTDINPILEGARRLISARNATGREFPRIGIHMTWMQKTLHGVPAMIDLSKALGADFFQIAPLHQRDDQTLDAWIQRDGGSWNYRDNLLSGVPLSDVEKIIDEFHSHADAIGHPICSYVFQKVRVSGDFPSEEWAMLAEQMEPERLAAWRHADNQDFRQNIDWKPDSIRCAMPFSEMFVHYEGAVHPCCWSLRPVGNLRDATLEEIWTGEPMRELRDDLVAGQVPKVCVGAGCPFINGKT